jgi:hypothetical protein
MSQLTVSDVRRIVREELRKHEREQTRIRELSRRVHVEAQHSNLPPEMDEEYTYTRALSEDA